MQGVFRRRKADRLNDKNEYFHESERKLVLVYSGCFVTTGWLK